MALALHVACMHVVHLLDMNSWGLPGMELLVPCHLCKNALCPHVYMLTCTQKRRCLLITMGERHVGATRLEHAQNVDDLASLSW